jgi:hypothetical protein
MTDPVIRFKNRPFANPIQAFDRVLESLPGHAVVGFHAVAQSLHRGPPGLGLTVGHEHRRSPRTPFPATSPRLDSEPPAPAVPPWPFWLPRSGFVQQESRERST